MIEEIQQQQPTQSQTSLKDIKDIMKTQWFWTQTNIDSISKNILTNVDFTWKNIVGYIFSSFQNLDNFTEECSRIPKGLCAGSITSEQQCYKCFDCGRDTQYHIFCSKCFESGFLEGKHKNHRFKSQVRLNGSCDCGEVSSIQKQGFCPSHSGKRQCDMKLNETMYIRLQQVILKCFEILFNYCDESMTYTKLFPESNIIVSTLKLGQINQIINNVIQTLVYLICDFGEDKIPFKFAISEIMMKPFNRKLMHGCNSNKFEDTFSRRQQHICHNSISELILKYSIALQYKQDLIDHIFYSLFVNPIFRKYLSNVFQDLISFILVIFKKPRELPICSVLQPFLLFCQFLAGQYTDNFVLNPSFNNIVQKSKLIIQIVNKQYFGQFDTAMKLFGVYQRIQQTVSAEKKQNLSLKIMSYFLDISILTQSQNGNSYEHHQYKLTLNFFLLSLFQGYISIIKYQEKESKNSVIALIHKYFQNMSRRLFINLEDQSKQKINNNIIEDQKMVVEQQIPQIKQALVEDDGYDHTLPVIKLDWYRLTDFQIGILITSLYVQYGYEEIQKILNLEVKHGFIQVFINKLITGQINGYKISKSKDVGFPNQYTPKQLYKFFIKYPQRLLYDSSLAILQIMAHVFPQQFMKQLKSLQQYQYLCKLLSDIFLQQTCFVNFSTKCNFESNLIENSLKIEMINILNLKSKNTFAELKKSFLSQMFFQQVSFEQVLLEVAIYDPKTQCYIIKEKYKNFQEGIFVRRTQDEFGNLFVGEDSYFKLIDKGNLIQKQNEQNWDTVCQLATKSITQNEQFLNIFQKIVKYVWSSQQSVSNYQNSQLIFTILMRNNNQKLKYVLQQALESDYLTLPQKLLKRIFNKLNNISTQSSLEKPITLLNSKQNRMKAHIQKLKKQQSLFEQNNTQLFEQILKTTTQQKQQKQEVCLICHQGKIQDQYICFTLYLSSQIISDQQILVYNSCGHLFHLKCIQEQNSNNCPFCITPWNTLFPILPSFSYSMMNPITNQNIKLIDVNKQLNFPDVDVVLQKTTQLIFSKIFFSVLNSCQKFAKRDLKQLRSLYIKCVLSNQKQREFINCQQLVQGLYKRVSLLTQQNESAKNIPKLLYSLILLPLYMNCQRVKQIFNFVVPAFYTSIYVDNLLCFIDIKNQDIEGQIKFHEDTLCAKMNEFSKVIVFTYALLFEDKRNSVLENIKDQDTVAETLKQTFKQFLLVQPKFFFSYYNRAKQIPNRKNNIPKSLIPAPITVSLPQNYMDFHNKYYTLNCAQCEGITRANDKNQLWMCLLCGYRSCLKNCLVQDTAPDASLYLHFANFHRNIGIAIQMNSSLVAIIDRDFQFQYGYLYQDRCGRYNNEKIKKWTQLKLNDNKWNKLLQIIRKGMLIPYAAQNRLPFHSLQY